MDSSHSNAASPGRYGGQAKASRRRSKHTRQSSLPISCVDSSLQARVVMEQISRERSQIYQQSVVQTVLGQHGGHRKKPSDAKPKLKFPNIDDKTRASGRQLNVNDDRERFPRNSTRILEQSLPHATTRPGGSSKISQSTVQSCSSAGSSAGMSHHHAQQRPRAAVYKNGAVMRAQLTTHRSAGQVSSRVEERKTSPRRREVRRRYTPDAGVPSRARSPSIGRGGTNTQVPTRKRRGSSPDPDRRHSDQDIRSVEAHLKTQPSYQHKTRHISKSQESLHRLMHSQQSGAPQTGLSPSDWQLAREKSFEITFPGYDTRFVDLPDPTEQTQPGALSDVDRQIEAQIHASSVEKCRRWLNKWVLTT